MNRHKPKELNKKEYIHIKEFVFYYRLAKKILCVLPGEIKVSTNDYDLWTYKEESVLIMFYRHKTSSDNYHVRVRDMNSENKDRADKIMQLLAMASGSNCNFTRKISRKD